MAKQTLRRHPDLLLKQFHQAEELVSWYEKKLSDLWTAAHAALVDEVDPNVMRDQLTAVMRAFGKQSHSKSLIRNDWNAQIQKLGAKYRHVVYKCYESWKEKSLRLDEMVRQSEPAANHRRQLFDWAIAAHLMMELGLRPVKEVLQQYSMAVNHVEKAASSGKAGRPHDTTKPQRDDLIFEKFLSMKGTDAEKKVKLEKTFALKADTIGRIVNTMRRRRNRELNPQGDGRQGRTSVTVDKLPS